MKGRKPAREEFSRQPFKDLKKLLEGRKEQQGTVRRNTQKVPASQQEHDHDADQRIFREAMKEVREIKEYREMSVTSGRSRHAPECRNTPSDNDALRMLQETAEGKLPINLPDTQEYVEWIDPEYREDILNSLHKGLYSVQACLDLHGIVVEDARAEVDDFFRESKRKGYRCIKIIHGRGLRSPKGPVMKEAVVTWLLRRYRKNIVAFVSARQCDGGLGAVYVLLK